MRAAQNRRLALGLLVAILVPAAAGRAQISPGQLSHAHRDLDASDRCLSCHSAERGVDPARCLACHGALRDRLDTGSGLHSRPEYRSCDRCHIEHQGRGFDLVFWGEAGIQAFDHRLSGFALEGTHAALPCRDCHRPELLVVENLASRGADPSRTFLGLGTGCAACHADPHGGQFESASCGRCHGQTTWKPAVAFDHATTSFPLTGSHAVLTCARCHLPGPAGTKAAPVRYRGLATACASCHRDPHQNRFGARCQSCHRTGAWSEIDRSGFDHSKTRFPLTGKHAALNCDSCHSAAGSMRIAGHERCSTCHRDDPHAGQFAGRPAGGDCGDCHDTRSLRRSTFTVADHDRSAYPLAGAHRTTPCRDCHAPVPPELLEQAGVALSFAGPRPTSLLRFRFPATACPDCHRDPHAGDTSVVRSADGCLSCHGVASWKQIAFDHQATGFDLEGGHARVPCTGCHRASQPPGSAREVRLRGAPRSCIGCHADPHRGQFDRDGIPSACTPCHHTESWSPTGFRHDRDTAFKLEGAHRAVACVSCHPSEGLAGESFLRYRPVGKECADCHAGPVGPP